MTSYCGISFCLHPACAELVIDGKSEGVLCAEHVAAVSETAVKLGHVVTLNVSTAKKEGD